MEVVRKEQKTLIPFKTKLSGKDGFGLLIILSQVQVANGALPETVARWVAKNVKALTGQNKKWNDDLAAVNENYAVKAPKGQKGFIYAQRGIELEKNGDQVVRGDEGYVSPADQRNIISIHTGKVITLGKDHPDGSVPFELKMKDAGTEEVYAAEHIEAQELSYDVQLFKINPAVFEISNVAIPAADAQGNALQLPLLYDNLMVDDEDETEK